MSNINKKIIKSKKSNKNQKNGLKIRGKKSKSVVMNMPLPMVKELAKICNNGNGGICTSETLSPEDLRSAMYQSINAWKTQNKNPKKVIAQDINKLHDDLKTTGLHNHKESFEESGMIELLMNWMKTGNVNPDILKKVNKKT